MRVHMTMDASSFVGGSEITLRASSEEEVMKAFPEQWLSVARVDLTSSTLTQLPTAFFDKLPSLTAICAASCGLTHFPSMQHCRKLTRLDLQHNKLDDGALARVGGLRYPALQLLDVSHNQLTVLPECLRSLNALVSLKLNDNLLKSLAPAFSVEDGAPRALSQSGRENRLQEQANSAEKPTAQEPWPTLALLDLSNNVELSEVPAALTRRINITLSLAGCPKLSPEGTSAPAEANAQHLHAMSEDDADKKAADVSVAENLGKGAGAVGGGVSMKGIEEAVGAKPAEEAAVRVASAVRAAEEEAKAAAAKAGANVAGGASAPSAAPAAAPASRRPQRPRSAVRGSSRSAPSAEQILQANQALYADTAGAPLDRPCTSHGPPPRGSSREQRAAEEVLQTTPGSNTAAESNTTRAQPARQRLVRPKTASVHGRQQRQVRPSSSFAEAQNEQQAEDSERQASASSSTSSSSSTAYSSSQPDSFSRVKEKEPSIEEHGPWGARARVRGLPGQQDLLRAARYERDLLEIRREGGGLGGAAHASYMPQVTSFAKPLVPLPTLHPVR